MGSAAVLSQPSSERAAFTTLDRPHDGPPNCRHDPVVCNGWYGRARQGGARRGPKDAVYSVGCPGAGDAQEAAGAPEPEGGRDPRASDHSAPEPQPFSRGRGSRRGAARAVRADATSGGIGTFEPWKPRNG